MTQYRNNPRPRQWGRVPSSVVLKVQEGLRDGLTYFEIQQATGVSNGSVSRIRRNMNLGTASRRSSEPVPDKIDEAIREGVKMKMSYKDIKASFGVSASRIATIKRSMGLLGALSDDEQPAPTPRLVNAIRIAMGERDYWQGTASELLVLIDSRKQGIPTSASKLSIVLGMPNMIDALKFYDITVDRQRSGGARLIILTRSGITVQKDEPLQDEPQQDEPQQDVSTYTPQQYFEAISEGIVEYHRDLAVLENRLDDLTSKNKDLYDALIQAKAKATNWSAPPRIPNRNMSNGG